MSQNTFLAWPRRVLQLYKSLLFLYSVNLTEYVAMEPRVCVCMYVCMCVCVCVCDSATAQTDGWILMKFSTNDLTDIFFIYAHRA